jgi:hypothetical protein
VYYVMAYDWILKSVWFRNCKENKTLLHRCMDNFWSHCMYNNLWKFQRVWFCWTGERWILKSFQNFRNILYYWNAITLWEDEKAPIETVFSLSQQSTRMIIVLVKENKPKEDSQLNTILRFLFFLCSCRIWEDLPNKILAININSLCVSIQLLNFI